MTHTLVVGAAPVAGADGFYARVLSGAAHVVAADAAGEWCAALGRLPDVVVGDFDSSGAGAEERLRGLDAEIVTHPSDKDETDLDLAVALASERYGGPVRITAAFTGRIDHTLAALGALLRAPAGSEVAEPDWSARVCAPGTPLVVPTPPGTPVSVLAPGGASGVDVRGTRWELAEATLEPLSGWGISNEALASELHISTGDGPLLVILGCWTP